MRVSPITCLRPNPERELAEFVSLPYDVVSDDEARDYVARHPTSFLAIDRPDAAFPAGQDPYAPEVYAHARELLLERRRDFTLLDDQTPCLYLYRLEQDGHAQLGLVASVSVDEYLDGTIRRHELTRAAKEQDRVDHIRALGAQTGLILLAYRDNYALDMIISAATAAQPLYDFTDGEGCHQTVWRVARPAAIEAISATFDASVPAAYIADGHHRAAAAVRVAQEERAAHPERSGEQPCDTFLAALFPESQLKVLAYNRVVTDTGELSVEEFRERVEQAGFAWGDPQEDPVIPTSHGHFGVYLAGSWQDLMWRHEGEATTAVGHLDTQVLQENLVGPILGIEDLRTDQRISFYGGNEPASVLENAAGEHGVAFALYPTSVEELMAVADAHELMPPKSTWFEPKLRSGLFVRRV